MKCRRGGGGVKNLRIFADVLYVWFPTFVLRQNNMDVLNRYVSKIKPSNLVSELDSVAAAVFPSSASLSSLEAMVLNFRGR